MRIKNSVEFEITFVHFLVFSFCQVNLAATESKGDTVLYYHPEIIVAARQYSSPAPVIVREIHIDDFKALNAHNAAEALVQSVGINMQYGASASDAHAWIRGFRHRDVLILFDGIPIVSAFEGSMDLNEVSIDNIAKIKTIKSAPSVMYGTNGMGGIIDMVPQNGRNRDVKTVVAEVGKNDSYLLRVAHGGIHGGVNCYFSASYRTSDGYSLSRDFLPRRNEDGDVREGSEYAKSNFFVHVYSVPNALGQTSLFFNLSDTERGFTPQVGADDVDYEKLTESKRYTAGLSNEFGGLPAIVKLYYNAFRTELTSYADSTYREELGRDNTNDYAYGIILYSKPGIIRHNQILFSYTFNNDVYKAEGVFDNADRANVYTHAAAVEDEICLRDRFTVSAGAIFSLFEQPRIDRRLSALNLQIVASCEIGGGCVAHASAAQRTRFPKLRELYRSKYGNPDLMEQSTVNYELGLQYEYSKRINADVTFYSSRLNNLIERETANSLYENIASASFGGIECSCECRLADAFFGRLGYAFLDASEETEGGGRQLRSRPRHTSYIDLRYVLSGNVRLEINGIHVSHLYDFDLGENYVRLKDYVVLNAKVSVEIEEYMNAYAAVSNATDCNYEHRFGFPREGRAVRAGLELYY